MWARNQSKFYSSYRNAFTRMLLIKSYKAVKCCWGKVCKGARGLKMHQRSCRVIDDLEDELQQQMSEVLTDIYIYIYEFYKFSVIYKTYKNNMRTYKTHFIKLIKLITYFMRTYKTHYIPVIQLQFI
jgi:hypothetical protein